MKLCLVSSGDFFSDYGGGQVYVRHIVDEFFKRKGITIIVVSFCKGQISKTRQYNGIDVFFVKDKQSFRDVLLNTKIDIVHANGEKLITARLCKELGIPCVVTAHHGGLVCPAGTLLNTDDEICRIPADYTHCLKCYLRNTPTGLFWYPLLKHYSQQHYIRIGKRLERLPFMPFLTPIGRTGQIVTQKLAEWQELSQTATHFIAPSNAMAEALERNGCPKDKITVIPHGIPDNGSRSKVQGSISDKSYLTPHTSHITPHTSTINFYYVGRINYVKGIHILLKAFSSIDNLDIKLHLIGGAGNKAEQRYMERLQRQYRGDNRIIWHGKIPYDQMSDLIKKFDCLVHPAIYLEVFGLNIAEALQAGKYVIATRCGGAEMQIHSDSEGLLVEPNNKEALTNAIKQFISHPHISSAIVKDISQHVEELIKFYQNTMQLKCQA